MEAKPNNASETLIDLSHEIEEGLVTYKGLPAPIICDYLSREASKSHYEDGTTFQIGKIEMVVNTGTYIDAPFHRFADKKDIAELSLRQVAAIPGIKVTVPEDQRAIDAKIFKGLDLSGKAVLVQTNWSRHWKTDQYFEGHPFLTEDAADYLRSQNVQLVGIDSLNIDDTATGARPVHTILLSADILIVEHMCNLDQIPEANFEFYAVPVKMKGTGSFPVRAFGKLLKRD
ncbi:cyclase family protein [Aliikangiella marina]|uniref:Cyclase family protein n=1 Tax=Aliikangiella marina TaxID=1712262 RepID=A0A545T9E6_9GAMM|nr:cyclase family protein [Aliikangiella marina]TQV73829.1 cyclase family protein [Aliikangiella marina]